MVWLHIKLTEEEMKVVSIIKALGGFSSKEKAVKWLIKEKGDDLGDIRIPKRHTTS